MDLDLETGEQSVEVTSLVLTVYIINLFFLPAQYMAGKYHGSEGADPTSRFQEWSCEPELAHESLVQDAG